MPSGSSEDCRDLVQTAKLRLDNGDTEGGIALLAQASVLAESTGDSVAQAGLLSSLALAQKHAGQFNNARETFLRVVDLLKEQLAQALNNLGFVERDMGALNAARKHHEEALSICEAITARVGLARTLTNLGVIHKDQGRLTEARASFERAIALLTDQDPPNDQADALLGLGLTLEKLNNFKEAYYYYEKALIAYRRANDHLNEAVTLHALGELHSNQEEFDAARGFYHQSLEISRTIKAKWVEANNLSSLASLHQMTEEPHIARQIHEAVLRLQQEIGDRLGQVLTLTDLAILDRDAHRFDTAEQRLTEALVLAQDMNDPHQIYDAYLNRGDVHQMACRTQQAMEDYEAAVEAAESVRISLLLEREALDYFNVPRLEAYDRLVDLYVHSLRDARQALRWAERGKAREFLRRLRFSEIMQPRRIPKELTTREARLLFELHQVAQALLTVDAMDRLAMAKTYEATERALYKIWIDMEAFDQEYVALRRGEPIGWDEMCFLLKRE